MTTTTTDTLTRWLPLFEQDEGLRPEVDGWKLVTWGREWSWICNNIYRDAPVGLTAMAIRDSAVRWLAERRGPIVITRTYEWHVALSSPYYGADGYVDTLDDALYAACKAVLGEEKT